MKPYYVIFSEHGAVGYPQGFSTKAQAMESFNKHPKAILVRRCKYHESVIDSKGLTEEEVDALMG